MLDLRFQRGLTLREIGVRYGISRERVRQIIGNTGRSDDRIYCIDCGTELKTKTALRCLSCSRKARKRWTKAEVLRRMHAWDELHGESPRWEDWKGAGGEWPPATVVQRLFGSWNAAIEAAGYEPRRR